METNKVWFYTIREGGKWISFLEPYPLFEITILQQLQDERRRFASKTFGGEPKVKLSCIPDYYLQFVHSVLFPDGRVWDAHLNGFDPSTGRHVNQ